MKWIIKSVLEGAPVDMSWKPLDDVQPAESMKCTNNMQHDSCGWKSRITLNIIYWTEAMRDGVLSANLEHNEEWEGPIKTGNPHSISDTINQPEMIVLIK
jgi:hypothetical protein